MLTSRFAPLIHELYYANGVESVGRTFHNGGEILSFRRAIIIVVLDNIRIAVVCANWTRNHAEIFAHGITDIATTDSYPFPHDGYLTRALHYQQLKCRRI